MIPLYAPCAVAVAWIVSAYVITIPSSLKSFVLVFIACGVTALCFCWFLAEKNITIVQKIPLFKRILRLKIFQFRKSFYEGFRYACLLLLLIAVASLLVLSSVANVLTQRQEKNLERYSISGQQIILELMLTSSAHPIHGDDMPTRWRWKARYQDEANIPVYLTLSAGEASEVRKLGWGTTVSIRAMVKKLDSYNIAAYELKTKKILSWKDPQNIFLAQALKVRNDFSVRTQTLPRIGADLLPGLVLGDETALNQELDLSMKKSSLSHLTAVSGSNCAVVLSIVFFATRWLRCTRRVRICLALIGLVAFVCLVGPSSSVIRAACMAIISLWGLFWGKSLYAVLGLSCTVLVLLLYNPWFAREYGFVLSVLATAGIIVLGPLLISWLSQYMYLPFACFISIPVAAQIACQPVLFTLNPSIPVYGVLANIVAEPAAGVATLFALLSCVFQYVFEPIAHVLLWGAWLPSWWIVQVAIGTANIPGSSIPFDSTGPVVALSILTILGLGLLVSYKRVSKSVFRIFIVCLCVLLSFVFGTVSAIQIQKGSDIPNQWTLAACDVGQGDAFFVRSATYVMMIDVGRSPQLVRKCMSTLNIHKIDVLVLTHFDQDHIGGLEAVIDRVEQVFVGQVQDETDQKIVDVLRVHQVPNEQVFAGKSLTLTDLSWKIVWPKSTQGAPVLGGNPGSIIVETQTKGVSALFLGDLDAKVQDEFLKTYTNRVDIVKVAHHGSSDQSERLYDHLQAQLGIISVGRNTYGHPTQKTLNMLAQHQIAVARTDIGGLLLIVPEDSEHKFRVWQENMFDSE